MAQGEDAVQHDEKEESKGRIALEAKEKNCSRDDKKKHLIGSRELEEASIDSNDAHRSVDTMAAALCGKRNAVRIEHSIAP